VPMTRSPSLTLVTPSPTAATSPAPSESGTTPSFVGTATAAFEDHQIAVVKRAGAHSHQDLLRPGPGILARSQDDPQTLVEARDHIVLAQRTSSKSSGLAPHLPAFLKTFFERTYANPPAPGPDGAHPAFGGHTAGETPHSPPRRGRNQMSASTFCCRENRARRGIMATEVTLSVSASAGRLLSGIVYS
jgi:hypothetical protein